MRAFPFGKAAFTLLICALLTGGWLALHPPPPKTATLTLWTFAQPHYEAYQTAARSFEAAHPGMKIDVQLVSNDGLAARLQAAFQADLDVPDLAEIEISTAGTFFRGPLNHIGFVDLTDRIHRSGLWDRMVQARFAPYTRRGRIFGLPHDVHPVQLAYRRDLFAQLNIDPDKIETWDDFIAVGRRVTVPGRRYMIEFSDTSRDNLETCLLQHGGGYFDPQGHCILDNDRAVETLCWYVPLVAGKTQIGNSLGGGQILTKAVEDGYLLCVIAPDWRTKSLEKIIPRMAGKMALMPFPALTRGGPRTSTWGGTMLGITRHCRRQELAWEFAQHLYLDKSQLAQRFADTNILPALRDAWDQPAFHDPRPYWSNQPLGALYARLAPQVPFQYSSPFIETAKNKLSEALVACVAQYKEQGDAGFRDFVRARLRQSGDEVRRLIARNPY
jgi:arabinosaccharide transport system substrate-binding protein